MLIVSEKVGLGATLRITVYSDSETETNENLRSHGSHSFLGVVRIINRMTETTRPFSFVPFFVSRECHDGFTPSHHRDTERDSSEQQRTKKSTLKLFWCLLFDGEKRRLIYTVASQQVCVSLSLLSWDFIVSELLSAGLIFSLPLLNREAQDSWVIFGISFQNILLVIEISLSEL